MNGIDFNPKGYVSFMNERTVEYLLLPRLISKFKKHFPVVIPFYFWATREGGYRTGADLEGKELKIVSFYPRRPKISSMDDKHIVFKINQEIFEKADFLVPAGIPVITGTPLIKTIADIPECRDIYWTSLAPKSYETLVKLEIELAEDLSTPMFNGSLNLNFEQFLNSAKFMNWQAFLEILMDMRYAVPRRSFFGGAYKPIYLLLMKEQ
jgi:hypothetical protein